MTLLTEALFCWHITHTTEFKHRAAGENSPIYEIYPSQYVTDPKILKSVATYLHFKESQDQLKYMIIFDNQEPDYAMVALMDENNCVSQFKPVSRSLLELEHK